MTAEKTAQDVLAEKLADWIGIGWRRDVCDSYAQRILEYLAADGWAVVKTKERSEYAVGDLVTDALGQHWVRETDQSWGWITWPDGECVIDGGYLDRIPERPLIYIANVGEPVPEGSDQ